MTIKLDLIVLIEGKSYRAGELPDGRFVVEKLVDAATERYEFPIMDASAIEAVYV